MATVNYGVRVSATIKDSWGIEASTAAYANLEVDTATIADVVSDWSDWVSALDNATDGQIIRSDISISPSLPGDVKGSPVSGSRVEQTGLLGFSATGTTKRYSFPIPALANGASVLSGDRMVMTSGFPIPALEDVLTTAGAALTWCNDHHQEISAFLDALISFRKKRKQLQKSSYEL